MPEKRMSLSDLQDLLQKYRDSLKAGPVQRYTARGNRESVDQQAVDDAIKALDSAAQSLSNICQAGVLAVVVTEDE